MSGFEVAGIVLGSIPIVVVALEYYMKGASTLDSFRSYKRVLNRLILVLKVEHAILQDICEKLLIGIASQPHIESMIENPFGPLWKEEEYSQKLQLRLWRSFGVFESTVLDMREAINDMRTKLNVGPDGKVQGAEDTSFRKYFKRASFVLLKSNHEECITRIRDGVSSLQKLACLNLEMEPERKIRSQGRLNQMVREISGSIYQALRSSMTCQCPSAHSVGLRLTPPLRAVGPEDDDDSIAKKLEFGLAISLQPRSSNNLWREMVMKIAEDTASGNIAKGQKRNVRFPLAGNIPVTDTAPSLAVEIPLAGLELSEFHLQRQQIGNLCDTIQRLRDGHHDCGCMMDRQSVGRREFRIRALESPRSDWALIPIKELLHRDSSCHISYGERLQLARIIACGVLQVYGTQWMPCSPTHNDIYLVQKQGILDFQYAFVLQSLPERGTRTSLADDPIFLSLGILLIELILGQTMEKLQAVQSSDGDIEHLVSKYEAAAKLLGRVNMVGGPGCFAAVQRCIRCDVYRMPLDINREMIAEAFAGIVGPLEEDLSYLF
ncbi:hypothetical protein S40293_10133 [Stachybotrys chartarum IBT 40293]|nr:hypothetical protein S40293_10133 [Stachybotrys chartarum IBT 40293]